MKKFKLLLRKFEAAAIRKAWKGGVHPDSIPAIEAEYKKARIALINYINQIIKKSKEDLSG